MKYGIALLEKPGTDGLNRDEIVSLYDMTGSPNGVFPIELMAKEHESSAMGFITPEAASLIGYDYSGLHDFIASILDDMDKESPDHRYRFRGIDIYLFR